MKEIDKKELQKEVKACYKSTIVGALFEFKDGSLWYAITGVYKDDLPYGSCIYASNVIEAEAVIQEVCDEIKKTAPSVKNLSLDLMKKNKAKFDFLCIDCCQKTTFGFPPIEVKEWRCSGSFRPEDMFHGELPCDKYQQGDVETYSKGYLVGRGFFKEC